MKFEKNIMLFGADSTSGIVAIALGETARHMFSAGKRMDDRSDTSSSIHSLGATSDVVDLASRPRKSKAI